MKTSIYLLAVLGGSLLASCSSDSITPQPEPGQTARIEVTLTGSNTGTRANGSTLPVDGAADEQKVNNIVIGIFKNSDGSIVTIQDLSSPKVGTTDADKNVITCPLTGTSDVTCTGVVVANVPASSITALKSSTTKTDFLSKTISLEKATSTNSDGTAPQLSANLPMSGDIKETTVSSFSLTPGGTKTGLSVQLTRMASRITLTSLGANFTSSAYPNAKFKLQRVLLRDAIASTNVTTSATASSAMPSSPSYLTGGGTWSGTAWDESANPYLFDDLGTALEITSSTTLPGGNYYWFYAFANDGSSSPTSFVIQGIFDVDGDFDTTGDASTVFYPVIVNKNQPGTTYSGGATTGTTTGSISRNTLYNLAVTLKNKGVSSPTENINPANLEINVSVAGWPAAIVQTVDFN